MTTLRELAPYTNGGLRFVFVRHGAAEGVEGRCIGHTDVPISRQGAEDVRALAASSLKIRTIICSDLARARQSAQIISEVVGATIATDARLREMNFGEWDGQLWSEIEQADGERLSAWMDHWMSASPPFGETVQQLFSRVASWLNEQLAQSQPQSSAIVVVAHAGSIRAAISLLTRTPVEHMFDIVVDHAHATLLEQTIDGWVVVKQNAKHIL